MKYRPIAAIAALTLLGTALAGCSPSPTTNTSDTSASNTATTSDTSTAAADLNLITAGTLTVCSDVPYAPFEYEDSTSPSGYVGFDIDLITAIADGLGLKVVVLPTDFTALQSGVALAAGQCDIGASAITITDERKANIDFTDPNYDSLQSLMVRTDSGIKTLADLAGKKIGVQAGTTGEIYTNANKPADAQTVAFPTDGEMWLAIQAGQVDALLQDLPVNQVHVKADSNYVIAEQYNTDEHYGFALAKGKNPALLAAVNAGLKTLRDNGTYQTLYNKYFG
ncbi:MAG: ABC transporter substrate-binding protein [Propionibacteriaceae bacterium]|nr:ABC transporter substrate-binding protein [Propionibacteriaceae bacterium]